MISHVPAYSLKNLYVLVLFANNDQHSPSKSIYYSRDFYRQSQCALVQHAPLVIPMPHDGHFWQLNGVESSHDYHCEGIDRV